MTTTTNFNLLNKRYTNFNEILNDKIEITDFLDLFDALDITTTAKTLKGLHNVYINKILPNYAIYKAVDWSKVSKVKSTGDEDSFVEEEGAQDENQNNNNTSHDQNQNNNFCMARDQNINFYMSNNDIPTPLMHGNNPSASFSMGSNGSFPMMPQMFMPGVQNQYPGAKLKDDFSNFQLFVNQFVQLAAYYHLWDYDNNTLNNSPFAYIWLLNAVDESLHIHIGNNGPKGWLRLLETVNRQLNSTANKKILFTQCISGIVDIKSNSSMRNWVNIKDQLISQYRNKTPEELIEDLVNISFAFGVSRINEKLGGKLINLIESKNQQSIESLIQECRHLKTIEDTIKIDAIKIRPPDRSTPGTIPPTMVPKCEHGRRSEFCYKCTPVQCKACRDQKLPHLHETGTIKTCVIAKRAFLMFQSKDNHDEEINFDNLQISDNANKGKQNYFTFLTKSNDDLWCADTGANDHFSNNSNGLKNLKQISRSIFNANGQESKATVMGDLKISKNLSLEICVVPSITTKLLSVGNLCDLGYSFIFHKSTALAIHSTNPCLYGERKADGLFYFNLNQTQSTKVQEGNKLPTASSSVDSLMEWHRRYAHLNPMDLIRVSKIVTGMHIANQNENHDQPPCESCTLSHTFKGPFKSLPKRATRVGERIHVDLLHITPISSEGYKYILIAKDEFSNMTFHHFCMLKTDAYIWLKHLERITHNNTGRYISFLRSDNEFFRNTQCTAILQAFGTLSESSCPHMHQQAGAIERHNRTILEPVRTILADSKCQSTHWPLIVSYVIYTRNRSPSKSCGIANQVPIQIWYGASQPPHVSHLRIFGEACVYHVPKENRPDKLTAPGANGTFVGYDLNRAAYLILKADGTSIVPVPYQNVKFYTDQLKVKSPLQHVEPITKSPYDIFPSHTELDIIEETQNYNHPPVNLQSPTTSKQTQLPPSTQQSLQQSIEETQKETHAPAIQQPPSAIQHRSAIPQIQSQWTKKITRSGLVYRTLSAREDGVPQNIKEMNRLEPEKRDKFIIAIKKEWQAYLDLGVFTLVPRETVPLGTHPLPSRHVFAIKLDEHGEIVKYKYRVTPKGFLQQQGKDYHKTASPTGSMVSLRILLLHAAHRDWEIDAADVMTAFLRATIDVDTLFVELPAGLHEILNIPSNMVMHMHKSMPGLKQSSYTWNAELDAHLVNTMGLTRSQLDPCVYLKLSPTGEVLGAMHVYVDDNTYFGPRKIVDEMKDAVSVKFPQEDQGSAQYILGLQIHRDRKNKTLILHQSDYIEHILINANMTECKPSNIPANPAVKLSTEQAPQTNVEQEAMKKVPYRSIVGSLLHLVVNTRPDIAFAVSQVCRYTNNPGSAHWEAVKQILRYLKGTATFGIQLSGSPMQFLSYSDSDWAGESDKRRSTTGFVLKVGDSSIVWKSKLQTCTTRSSFAAESVALTSTVDEIIWMRMFLQSLGYKIPSTDVKVDNQSVITTLKGSKCPARTKHVEVRFHWLKEHIDADDFHVSYVSTNENLADMFTKALGKEPFQRHRSSLNMQNVI